MFLIYFIIIFKDILSITKNCYKLNIIVRNRGYDPSESSPPLKSMKRYWLNN